jgi:hypothetical protein
MWNFVSENKFKPKNEKDVVKFGGSIASYPTKKEAYTPISGVSPNFMNSHKYKMKSLDYQNLMAPKKETEGVDLLRSPEKNPFDFKGMSEKPKEDDRFPSFYQYNAKGKTYFDNMVDNYQEEVGTMNDLSARKLNNESGIDLENVSDKTSAYNSFFTMWQSEKKNNLIGSTINRISSSPISNLPTGVEIKPFRSTYKPPTIKKGSTADNISPIKPTSLDEDINDISFSSTQPFPEEQNTQVGAKVPRTKKFDDDELQNDLPKALRLDFMSSDNALNTAIFLLDLTNSTIQTKYYNAFKMFDKNRENITPEDVIVIKTFLNSVLDNKIVPRRNLTKSLRQDFLNMRDSMNQAIAEAKNK